MACCEQSGSQWSGAEPTESNSLTCCEAPVAPLLPATFSPPTPQIGTVVEGAADFFSGRLTKRERKGTFAEEVMVDAGIKTYRKRRFDAIQDAAQLARKKRFKAREGRERGIRRQCWAVSSRFEWLVWPGG